MKDVACYTKIILGDVALCTQIPFTRQFRIRYENRVMFHGLCNYFNVTILSTSQTRKFMCQKYTEYNTLVVVL